MSYSYTKTKVLAWSRWRPPGLRMSCYWSGQVHGYGPNMLVTQAWTPQSTPSGVKEEDTMQKPLTKVPSSHVTQSDLSFFLPPPMGTLLATAEPTAVTPPATADTLPFTSPTPIAGTAATEVTAAFVRSKLFPPTQATPPTVAPTAPFVTLNRPPATLENMPGWGWGWSLLGSTGYKMKC